MSDSTTNQLTISGDRKVSVVIPTLNEEKYLPNLLESLRRQMKYGIHFTRN